VDKRAGAQTDRVGRIAAHDGFRTCENMPNLTKEQVYSYSCHLVKGLARSGEEYAVLEAKSILRVIGIIGVQRESTNLPILVFNESVWAKIAFS
jgi:hypothetical protein